MARTVAEVMNPELFSVPPDADVRTALGSLLAFGVTGAPVTDADGRPVGVVSQTDLLDTARASAAVAAVYDEEAGRRPVRGLMTRPAFTVARATTLDAAGRIMAEHGVHRLVVVDEQGRAAGVVTPLDLLRGLLGLPAPHPATFPHLDAELQIAWSDEYALEPETIEKVVPDAPGVYVLVRGAAGEPDHVFFAGQSNDLLARMLDVVGTTHRAGSFLDRWLGAGHARFRYAVLTDPERRGAALRRLAARYHVGGEG
jgi:CBS domain-containing protein